jgi:hypothetical protein
VKRGLAALGTAVLVVVLLSPLARSPRWDSFPVSSYPMFARGDLGRVVGLCHALLVRTDGSRAPASPTLVGTPEPMIAAAVIRGHVERRSAPELCAAIATRARDEPGVVAVEIATSSFDTRRYFSDDPGARTPLRREVHARCEVRQ